MPHLVPTSPALRRVAGALDALLAPVEHDDTARWPAQALAALRELTGLRTASLFVADGPRAGIVETNAEPALLRDYAERFVALDPVWTYLRRAPGPVVRHDDFHDMARVESTVFFQEFLRPHGLRGMLMLNAGGGGEPGTHAYFSVREEDDGAEAMAARARLLETVAPAFRSGVALWQRFAGLRSGVVAAIDALDTPLALHAPAGQQAHRNPALAALLAAEPDRDQLLEAMIRLAREVGLRPRGGAAEAPLRPERRLVTAAGAWRLRACAVATAPRAPILVSLEPARPAPLTDADLAARFALTPRERDLVRLAAQGATNRQIAERLGLSPYTVRNRLEGAFRKLGIARRSEIAAKLVL